MAKPQYVQDDFYTVFDEYLKKWFFPAFPKKNSYSGEMNKIHFEIRGVSYIFWVPTQYSAGLNYAPQNVPKFVIRPCAVRCVLSASELLQQEKENDILQLAQNGVLSCPQDCNQLLLYNNARDRIVNQYVCDENCNTSKPNTSRYAIASTSNRGSCVELTMVSEFSETSINILKIVNSSGTHIYSVIREGWTYDIQTRIVCITPRYVFDATTNIFINETATTVEDLGTEFGNNIADLTEVF